MAEDRLQARLALGIRSLELSERYAITLEGLGFEILQRAPRGVSFAGGPGLFERVFACPIDLKPTPHFAGEPVLPPELRTHTEAIYFPTKPLFFKEPRP